MGLPVQQHYYLDADHLRSIALARGEDYRSSSPFPHAVIDDFLPEDVAHAAAAEFASLDASSWQLYSDSGNTTKLATSQECDMGPVLRHLSNQFNSQTFVLFLEQLTGIDGLVADPQLFGGGLHQLNPGGYLRVHADFNWHDGLHLDRRLNAILYLNPGWREEWGGAFEMWSTDMSRCEAKIAPVLNRLVVFNTLSTSFHGNPDPVTCPPNQARRSMAYFYYTNGRPDEERHARHSTLYQTPGEQPVAPDAGSAAPGRSLARRVARRLLRPGR